MFKNLSLKKQNILLKKIQKNSKFIHNLHLFNFR